MRPTELLASRWLACARSVLEQWQPAGAVAASLSDSDKHVVRQARPPRLSLSLALALVPSSLHNHYL